MTTIKSALPRLAILLSVTAFLALEAAPRMRFS
jgi:hypothetical protein